VVFSLIRENLWKRKKIGGQKMSEKMKSFIEVATVEEANNIPLDYYTFLERMSAVKGIYCFKIREAKR
jgi:hypothetical protein